MFRDDISHLVLTLTCIAQSPPPSPPLRAWDVLKDNLSAPLTNSLLRHVVSVASMIPLCPVKPASLWCLWQEHPGNTPQVHIKQFSHVHRSTVSPTVVDHGHKAPLNNSIVICTINERSTLTDDRCTQSYRILFVVRNCFVDYLTAGDRRRVVIARSHFLLHVLTNQCYVDHLRQPGLKEKNESEDENKRSTPIHLDIKELPWNGQSLTSQPTGTTEQHRVS